MRVFVTGASGWIGSAVVPELLRSGHQVLGLARSDASAAALEAAGAKVQRGGLDDLGSLREGAEAADGVIHLAYNHDFSDMAGAAASDRLAIETFGDVLKGSHNPLLIASGTLGLSPGRVATELDRTATAHPRGANAVLAASLADHGVRSVVVRLSPTVHGQGDHGFLAVLVAIAREKGFAAYIGDGANRWTAVHRLDAALLFRLALEQATPGTILHGAAEEGVTAKDIATAIGKHLDIPVSSIPPEDAAAHFGWIGMFFGMDSPASSALTRQWLGWEPTQPGLIEDLEHGQYFQI